MLQLATVDLQRFSLKHGQSMRHGRNMVLSRLKDRITCGSECALSVKISTKREVPVFNDGDYVLPPSFNYDKFSHAVMGEDDIGFVILCHFEAERTITFALEYLTSGRCLGQSDFAEKTTASKASSIKATWQKLRQP
jgi:hypothetical protein